MRYMYIRLPSQRKSEFTFMLSVSEVREQPNSCGDTIKYLDVQFHFLRCRQTR
jgi:hypothetical protein